MTDPIQARSPGPTPPASATSLVEAPVEAARSSVPLDRLMVAASNATWAPDEANAALDQTGELAPRPIEAETQAKLNAWVGGIFVQRPTTTQEAPAPVAVTPTFDPASARRNGNGSLVPPRGRPIPGAPPPGGAPVSPPGLERGNTIIRHAANGSPSNFQILDQLDTNGCGTTSLAMLLNFLAGGKKLFDRPDVDAAIRHYNLFTSPGEIAAFARRRGLDAAITSGATPADLRRMVDQGLPVQVLLDVSDAHDGSGLHFELVTGYGVGPDGKGYFELANPWGMREYMAEDALMARWGQLSAKGFPLGIDRVAITVKPRGSAATLLPNEEGAWLDSGMTALRVARGLTQTTSAWARRDGATLTAGVVRLLVGGLVAIPALLGHAGRQASAALMREGLQDLKQPGGWGRGSGKSVVGGLGVAVSAIPEAMGNVANRLVDALAEGTYGLLRAAGSWR